MVLTKARLVKQLIQADPHLNADDALLLIENFFHEIRDVLAKGEEVKLSGFGTFHVLTKKERPGRNPKTGEVIPVKARRVVTFHPSEKLQAEIGEKAD